MFGRRSKKEATELKTKYNELEGKYEHLSTDYETLKVEAGEKTNMRISAIEVEIESMNSRVEKLANDSYEIHSELREIKDSVTEMHTSLKEIVQLYKAILTRYGTPAIREQQAKAAEARRRAAAVKGAAPGDAVVRTLRAESDAERPGPPTREVVRSRQPRPVVAAPAPAEQPAEAPAPPPPPPPPSALDELQRAEAEDRAEGNLEGDALARRLAARETGGERVDRVVRRDAGRPAPIREGADEGFLRPLPKKQLYRKAPEERPTAGGWVETPAPKGRQRALPEDVPEPE